MPFQLPSFSGHRVKETVTFSERQRQRRRKAADPSDEAENEAGTVFPLGGHRIKDKETFSERQRRRKQGDLEGGESGIHHRTKSTSTFSERQRQRKKGAALEREEDSALDIMDGVESLFPGMRLQARKSSNSPGPSLKSTSSSMDLAPRGQFLSPGRDEELLGSDDEDDSLTESASPTEAGSSQLLAEQTAHHASAGFGLKKLRLGASAKRLLSGAFAGSISRTAVAPLETIRTHLMVGKGRGSTVSEVFRGIMEKEGWTGLFRGNGLNVLRVAPSKAIELFTFDTVKKALTDPSDGKPRIPFPIAPIAGASAGICSTLATYPLELLKTRLTVFPDKYKNVPAAVALLIREEGVLAMYRGLIPSIIGVIPYAAANYYAYDSLRHLHARLTQTDRPPPIATLVMGSLAGAIASTATFPLEVARKQMQVGGGAVYKNTLDALTTIAREQGAAGLYRGLGPSCMKLMPAAGISFMCYEALKQLLIEEEAAAAQASRAQRKEREDAATAAAAAATAAKQEEGK